MSDEKKKNQLHNIATVILLFGIMILALSFGQTLKSNMDDAKNKDKKISVLISEVGEIKQNLDTKDSELLAMYNKMVTNKNQILSISKKIDQSNKILTKSNDELSNKLMEKEKIISDLALINLKLKEELIIRPLDPKYKTYL